MYEIASYYEVPYALAVSRFQDNLASCAQPESGCGSSRIGAHF